MEELYKQRLRELYDAVNTGNGLEQAMVEARVLLGVTDCDLKRPEPNWGDAPDWAEWWAVDNGGFACWYQNEPVTEFNQWDDYSCGMIEFCSNVDLQGFDWRETLTPRP